MTIHLPPHLTVSSAARRADMTRQAVMYWLKCHPELILARTALGTLIDPEQFELLLEKRKTERRTGRPPKALVALRESAHASD